MQILFSPTKQMNFNSGNSELNSELPFSKPLFSSEARMLNSQLKKLSRQELAALMKMSDTLADQTYQLIRDFDGHSGGPAIYTYSGTSFQALDPSTLDKESLLFARDRLCILSGMYGLLSPLDLISPYRLEMKTALSPGDTETLSAFWKPRITNALASRLNAPDQGIIINLASGEYSKTIDKKSLGGRIINFQFKDKSASGYKTVGMYAKTARGEMLRRILSEKIINPDILKKSSAFDYEFRRDLSCEEHWIFTRG